MEQSEISKLEAARTKGWGPLDHQYNGYPPRIQKLQKILELWLHGETITYTEFGFVADGGFRFLADATELNVFVLTEQYAVLAVIPRDDAGNLGSITRYQVRRSKLSDLQTTLPASTGLFTGLEFTVDYDGFPRPVTIKPTDSTSAQPDLTAEKELFASLRDDLYTE
ncbi:hypothetical protein ACNPNP_08830 [Microbacterium sp. AGC85]